MSTPFWRVRNGGWGVGRRWHFLVYERTSWPVTPPTARTPTNLATYVRGSLSRIRWSHAAFAACQITKGWADGKMEPLGVFNAAMLGSRRGL